MLSFIIIVALVVCVLLILVVLAQTSKGGLASGMGGASQLIGARRTTDTIEKATWILAAALFVLCLSANVFTADNVGTADEVVSPNVQRAKEDKTNTPVAQPSQQQGGTENSGDLFKEEAAPANK
jgi:preprotein translocase subunit SecG